MTLKKVSLFSTLLMISINAFAQETLIFAFDVIRHGDRTPLRTIPNSPYVWPEGLGQLTAEGMQQEFQRGVAFRKKYIDDYHLLSSHYKNQEIIVFSTNADRTLMSAQSVLLGLYPLGTGPTLSGSNKPALPYHFQPVPIHIKAKDASNFRVIDSDLEHHLLKKHVFTQPEWRLKTEKLRPQLIKWSRVTGMKINNLHQVRHLADILHVYQLHHIPMPVGLSADDVKQIIETGAYASLTEYKTKQIADILGVNLLKTIARYLEQASKQKTSLKYVLFSGHDSTIMSLMTTMQLPLTIKPPYGANLNFALFKTGNTMLVRVTYNGQLLVPKGCTVKGCTLSQFLQSQVVKSVVE